jgi:hypothetical protein
MHITILIIHILTRSRSMIMHCHAHASAWPCVRTYMHAMHHRVRHIYIYLNALMHPGRASLGSQHKVSGEKRERARQKMYSTY